MRAKPSLRFAVFVSAALAAGAAGDKPQVVTGSFAAGERYVPPADHAPARVSRASVRTVALENGRAVVDLPVTGGGRLIVWSQAVARDEKSAGAAAGRVASALRLPSGRALEFGEGASADRSVGRYALEAEDVGLDLPGAQEAIHVRKAEAGLHQIELLAGGASAVTIVSAEPDSALTLETWAGPLSRQPGQPVELHATLRDGSAGLGGARVTARLAPPARAAGATVDLFDDGLHDDGAAGDGEYAATLRGLPSWPGLWSARFEAEGRDARGLEFARTGSSGFVGEAPSARLLPRSLRARLIGEGPERRLRVEAAADVARPGSYRFDVIVAGAPEADGSRAGRAWGEAALRLAAGKASLALDIPGTLVGDAGGPLLLDLRLLALDTLGVAARATLEVTP
jgi:hypothetical protein